MQKIDKLAWVCLKNKKALFVRSKNKSLFYNPGGKREGQETDAAALIREIKEEVSVDLIPESLRYVNTFTAQADSKPEGTMVELKCYSADYLGELTPASEIEELGWLTSIDMEKTSASGKLTLQWLKQEQLID